MEVEAVHPVCFFLGQVYVIIGEMEYEALKFKEAKGGSWDGLSY
jgi:hypothetical protein